jgi:hypothetical protein
MTALSPLFDRDPTPRPGAGRVFLRARRWALMALGLLVILLGIVIAPLPGPGGIPVIAVGLMLILKNSYWAKRQFIRAQRRHPRVLSPIRRLLGRKPPFAQVFWQQLLRLERLVTGKGHRFAARLRKKLKPRWRRAPAAAPNCYA